MPAGNPNIREVSKGTQFKPGQSGNPAGPKPGFKHITTHIQELLNDEKFTIMVQEGYEVKEYKGKPLKAILEAQVRLALNSRDEGTRIKATELLLKHGYSAKQEIDLTSLGNQVGQPIDQNLLTQFLMNVENNTKR